jgi:hypothetical protein
MRTKEELNEDIWLGNATGLSEKECIARLKDYEQMIEDLINHRITPSRIIGTGYKQPREIAFQWLAKQVIEYSHALITHGQEYNASNVEYRYNQQLKG